MKRIKKDKPKETMHQKIHNKVMAQKEDERKRGLALAQANAAQAKNVRKK